MEFETAIRLHKLSGFVKPRILCVKPGYLSKPYQNYGCCSAIACNELRLLIRHPAVRKDTHAGPQRIPSADVPSCGQKRHTRWPATNASACNELLARNESQVLMCHHAVRKDTHAGLQLMLRHAMNYGRGTQPVLTRAFCQKNKHIIAPAWNSKQQSDFINYQVL